MGTISLQIDGKYAFLEPDVSISIEEQSPVWGEGNSFSFPFELDVEANRHIIGNADQLTGGSIYQALEGKSAVIYAMGIPISYGKVSLDDEVDTDEGHIEITVVSSRMSFDEMIEGMNCQDVELSEEIILGEKLGDFSADIKIGSINHPETVATIKGILPYHFMRMRNNGVSTVNVSEPYDSFKYCNIRICYPLPEELTDEEKGPESQMKKWESDYNSHLNDIIAGKYVVLDAERPLSAPCFYVLYFLQCLFNKLNLDFDFEQIKTEEDIQRLAFVNTACKFKEVDEGLTEQHGAVSDKDYNGGWSVVPGSRDYPTAYWRYNITGIPFPKVGKVEVAVKIAKCIATPENFPKEDVSTVIKSLENAFGIRLLFDKQQTKTTLVYVRDILKGQRVVDMHADIIQVFKRETNTTGFVLKYSGGDEDTAFNYTEWEQVQITAGYNLLQASVHAFNKTCYVDSRNGNAYRVKNDSEATDLETQNPSLFEVGMFNKVEYGDCSNENNVATVEIPFNPIVVNDTEFANRKDKLRRGIRGVETVTDKVYNEQKFAAFLDVNMKYPSLTKETKMSGETTYSYRDEEGKPANSKINFDVYYVYFDNQRYDEKLANSVVNPINNQINNERATEGRRSSSASRPSSASRGTREVTSNPRVGEVLPIKYLDNDSPIQTFDAGLTLGIMRGPGNTAGIQDYDENYDGEGNSKYVTVPSNYAFHSDSVDNYGRVFDYNGTNDDGVSDHFSLKLRAEKPVLDSDGNPLQCSIPEAQRRGLFDRFYTEYAYFVTHRKIAVLSLRMELADIVNIDWTVRYRFGDYVGFVNKVNYTVSADGVSDVTVEMFYL